MFKFTYILLIFAFITTKAEEPTLVWERNDFDYTGDLYLTKDNTLLILDRYNNGTLWWLNPDTGEKLDSLITNTEIGDLSLTPDESIIACFGNGKGVFIYANTKEIFFQLQNPGMESKILDNENIITYTSEGLFKLNFKTMEKDTIWENNVYETNPPYDKFNIRINSCIDKSNKYALVVLSGAERNLVKLIDIENKQEVHTYGNAFAPAFNPARDEYVVSVNKKLNLYDLNDVELPKHVIKEGHSEIFCGFSDKGNYLIETHTRIFDLNKLEYVYSFPIFAGNYFFDEEKFDWYLADAKIMRKYNLSNILSINVVDNQGLIISPNPSRDIINVSVNIINAGDYQLTIHNLLGQEVINLNLDYISKGNFSKSINISGLPAGKYFLKISNKEHNIESSFIKEN